MGSGGSSQLESLLKQKNSLGDIAPGDLIKAHEMRTKVPLYSMASSSAMTGPGQGQALMTQAQQHQQPLMTTASNQQHQQQQQQQIGISQMNGPTTAGMEGGGAFKMEQQDVKPDLDIKTEFKTEADSMKQEPMETGGEAAADVKLKMETDIKLEVKEEVKPPATAAEVKTEDEAKPVQPKTEGGEVVKRQKVTFSRDELRNALLPPLEKMYACEPEAGPFRSPVDPNALGIPDYFEIIKTPMDMSTIRRKLEVGTYTNPWEFINDVFMMFENAWVYNRKTSRVYRYCTKVGFLMCKK